MTNNYDLKSMRIELITLLSASLNNQSKFYKEDYQNLVAGVNRKTRKELIESIERQKAIAQTTESEISRNCRV